MTRAKLEALWLAKATVLQVPVQPLQARWKPAQKQGRMRELMQQQEQARWRVLKVPAFPLHCRPVPKVRRPGNPTATVRLARTSERLHWRPVYAR